MDRRARRLRIGDVQDVQRDLDHFALGDAHDHAVLHERRVERREGRAVKVGELAEMRLHPLRFLAERLGERGHLHLGRELREVRERRLEPPVHEHQPLPRLVHEPGLKVRVRERGRTGLHRLEGALGDRRHRREVPVLVARGREAECGEALERPRTERREPCRPVTSAVRREGSELVRVRNGHGQTPAGSRSQS